MFRVKTYNKISPLGLDLFPRDKYEVSPDIEAPDAILCRSADLRNVLLPDSVLAIARAGAGYNNIPVAECSERAICVFNSPGANANAVKELTIAALFLSSRRVSEGIAWCRSLKTEGGAIESAGLDALVEKNKSLFEGPEIRGKTLGVVGLGAIGVMVANDALALGMDVVGYDPYISVEAAWSLSRSVRRAESIDDLLKRADYVTLHIPLSADTRGIINASVFAKMKKGARLLNLARGALVDEDALAAALDAGDLAAYVTDFPSAKLLGVKNVVTMPHLGASTPEAEDNCAIMAAQQLVDYLERGNIRNAVNFPRCKLDAPAESAHGRLAVVNRNIPNMVGQITTCLAAAGINITDLVNHHRDDYAYNIIDTETPIPPAVLEKIRAVDGIIRVRAIG